MSDATEILPAEESPRSARHDARVPLRERRVRAVRHATPRTYVKVATILSAITAAEVWIYYVESLRFLLVPFLMVFSALKFSLVVLFFMHLRYDSRSFATLFVTGLSLALTVFVIVLLVFGVFAR